MNTYLWLFRREVWENRAIWLLPAIVGGLLLIVALFGHIQVDEWPRQLSDQQLRVLGPMVAGGIGTAMFLIMSVYTSWYLLDCLYADRKDRSVLFWKSLPVTDTQTVLSKLAMALLVIPLVYFVIADITALAVSFVLSVRGGSPFAQALWHPLDWLQLQVMAVYAILTAALWFLPFSAWLLFVSSWARRSVMLWALLIPVAGCFIESRLLGTSLLRDVLLAHLLGYGKSAFHDESHFTHHAMIGNGHLNTPDALSEFVNLGGFLSSGEMWAGVVVGAALVGATIYMRHRFTEI
ncbi:MAG: hypothetical protein JSS24_00515 [Proteobacteria bacterium]|nr:hypothetical protein [Pseudomonadota bacterium]